MNDEEAQKIRESLAPMVSVMRELDVKRFAIDGIEIDLSGGTSESEGELLSVNDEPAAWDRYVTMLTQVAAVDPRDIGSLFFEDRIAQCARAADVMLAERRKRYPAAPAPTVESAVDQLRRAVEPQPQQPTPPPPAPEGVTVKVDQAFDYGGSLKGPDTVNLPFVTGHTTKGSGQ